MAPKTLNVTFAADSSQVGSAFDKIQSSSGSLGDKLSSLGGTLTKGVTLPLVALGVAGLKMAGDVDKGLREVNTLFGETGSAADATFKELQSGVKDLSNEIGVAQTTLTSGLYQAISAGVPKENVFDFMEVAAKAAIAGVTDTETAVDGLTTTLNAFGLDASRAQDVADSMFTAVKGGKTTFEELSASLFQVAPAAAAAGVKFTDVNAAIAALTASGVPTSVATTQIRQAIVDLTKDGTKASDAFEKISGKTFPEFIAGGGNLQDAFKVMAQAAEESGMSVLDLFGSVEAGGAALALTGTAAEKFTEQLEAQKNAAGATEKAFKEMDKAGMRKLEKAMERLRNGMIAVGNALLPIATAIIDKVGGMAKAFGALPEGIVKIIVVIGGLAAAVGPVLLIVGKLISLWPLLTAAFAVVTGPIGLVVAAIAALTAGLIYAWNHSEIFRNVVTAAFEAVKGVVMGAVNAIRLVISQLSAMWNNPDITSDGWFGIIEAFVGWLRSTFDSLSAWWKSMWPQFSEAVGHTFNIISAVVRAAVAVISGVLQVGMALIRVAWSVWGDSLVTILRGVWQVISSVVRGAVNVIGGIIKTALAIINGDWRRAWEGIRQIASGIMTALSGSIGGALRAIGGAFNAVIAPIRTFITWIGRAIAAARNFRVPGALHQRSPSEFEVAVYSAAESFKRLQEQMGEGLPNVASPGLSGLTVAGGGGAASVRGAITVNVYGSVVTERQLMDVVTEAVTRKGKANGTAFAGFG